jgi:hypothetical protein
LFAVGPDGIHGSTPSQSIELFAQTLPKLDKNRYPPAQRRALMTLF